MQARPKVSSGTMPLNPSAFEHKKRPAATTTTDLFTQHLDYFIQAGLVPAAFAGAAVFGANADFGAAGAASKADHVRCPLLSGFGEPQSATEFLSP